MRVALLIALAVAVSSPALADHVPDGEAVVVRVVDGDTVEVQLAADGEVYRVRYVGVDAPETRHRTRGVDCYSQEAAARNAELVLGATVYLERDVSDVDRFGRLVRHVWLGEELVAALLLAEGYVRAYSYPPDLGRAAEFTALQAEARAAGRGLWSACRRPGRTRRP